MSNNINSNTSQLLNSYDPYGDFIKENYFIQSFNCLPSKLLLELPVEGSSKKMQAFIDLIDFDHYQLEIVFKNWETSSNKNAPKNADFPYQYLYKSQVKKLCILITLEHEEIRTSFLYDQLDKELESWILETTKTLRNHLGKTASPIFKVLSKSERGFYTEEININHLEVDVSKFYNDDFLNTHQSIDKALTVDASGLILLHGAPGTGKTSYIKSLLSKHAKKNFIFVPNDFVKELLQPDFISFLISNKNSIFVIEDAEKVITSRENHNNSVVSTILQLTDGLFSDYLNIKIICTFNISIDRIDKALLRKGRMIAFYEFKALSTEKSNALLTSLKAPETTEPMTLAEIFNYHKEGFENNGQSNSIGF